MARLCKDLRNTLAIMKARTHCFQYIISSEAVDSTLASIMEASKTSTTSCCVSAKAPVSMARRVHSGLETNDLTG